MGSFYITSTFADTPRDRIIKSLRELPCFVGPALGCYTVVYPELMAIPPQEFSQYWGGLSHTLQCVLLVAAVMDDDVLYFELWERGEKRDEYTSNPAMWDQKPSLGEEPRGGNEEVLCQLFSCADKVQVRAILRASNEYDRYVLASQRHIELAHALGLPPSSANCGYDHIDAGEMPDDIDETLLTRLPQ